MSNKVFRKPRLTLKEKIDLFESYLKDKKDGETIVSSTTYKGYPLGLYLATIRHEILKNPLKPKKYTKELEKRLEDLGLLNVRVESNKTEKITRLIEFVKNNPELWKKNYRSDTETTVARYLDEIGESKNIQKREELIQLLDRARADYDYLRIRHSKGKLKEDDIKKLRDGKVGGVFREKEFIEEIVEQYGKNDKKNARVLKKQLNRDTRKQASASYEEYKEKYIQNLLKGRVPFENSYESRLYIKNFDLSEPDMISRNGYYNALLQELFHRQTGFIITDEIKEIMDWAMENTDLTEAEQTVLKLKYGEVDKLKTLEEMSKVLKVSGTRAGQCLKKALIKYSQLPSIQALGEYFERTQEQQEEFVRRYFKYNNIFIKNDIDELPEELKAELKSTIKSMHLQERIKAKQKEKDEKAKQIGIRKLDIHTGTGLILTKNGIETLYDLTQMTEKEIKNLRGLGLYKYSELEKVISDIGYSIGKPQYLVQSELIAECITDALDGKKYKINNQGEREEDRTSITEENNEKKKLVEKIKKEQRIIEGQEQVISKLEEQTKDGQNRE